MSEQDFDAVAVVGVAGRFPSGNFKRQFFLDKNVTKYPEKGQIPNFTPEVHLASGV